MDEDEVVMHELILYSHEGWGGLSGIEGVV